MAPTMPPLLPLLLLCACGAAAAVPHAGGVPPTAVPLLDGEPLSAQQREQLRTKPAHVGTPFDCATRTSLGRKTRRLSLGLRSIII